MIRDEDAEFHAPDTDDPTWAETNYFGFYNAEERPQHRPLRPVRPKLGGGQLHGLDELPAGGEPWEADYCDIAQRMPIPEPRACWTTSCPTASQAAASSRTASGTSPTTTAGHEIDVRYTALMPAYDIHDPARIRWPRSRRGGKSPGARPTPGTSTRPARSQGEVLVRGRKVPIDCVATMDHSWGPRPERRQAHMSWLHAHFADDLAVHGMFDFDQASNGTELWLAHGYVLDQGNVQGLKAGRATVERMQERFPERVELAIMDSGDNLYQLTSEALTTYPWQCQPRHRFRSTHSPAGISADSVGFGEIQDFFELPQLNALNADAATERPSRPVPVEQR